MHAIWSHLLFLHGHVPPKNLAWRPDADGARVKRKPAKAAMLARCAAVWPRLVGPR